MINVNNSQTNNVFKDFPQLKFGQPSFTVNSSLLANKPDVVDVKKGTANSPTLASVNVSDVNDKKGKKGGFVAATVGGSILAAGVIALVLTKGFSSTTYNKLNGLIEHLNDKIYASTISKKSKTFFEKGAIAFAKGLKGVLSGLKVTSNFNAVKDSFVNKMFSLTEPTRKFSEKVTKLFKRFADDAIDSAYNKVHLDTDDFCANLSNHVKSIKADNSIDLNQLVKISENGKEVEKPLSEVLKNFEKHLNEVKTTYEAGFGKEARIERDVDRQKGLENLFVEVWDTLYHKDGGLLNFKDNINTFKSYITEDLSLEGKTKLRNKINSHRKAFTNNVEHNLSLVKTSLKEIAGKLKMDDKESRDLLNEISAKLGKYSDCSGVNESKDRAAIVEELLKDFEAFNTKFNDLDKYSDNVKEAVKSEIEFITKDVLQSDKKGSLQEVMTLARVLERAEVKNNKNEAVKLIDEKMFNTIDKKSKEITKNINKAAKMESEDLYDKCAEFHVGSAPSDLVGLALPVGVAAYAISKGDDKQERISTTLTTGVPLIGSIGTMIYGTTRMLSGAKNLAFAAGTGLVLNFIGSGLDKLYKEYQEKRSFTKMAVDAYKKNTLLNPGINKT